MLKDKEKFRGYDLVNAYPEDGWLKGYFYAVHDDINGDTHKSGKAYQDTAAIRHRDYILHLLNLRKGERVLDVGCFVGALMVYCGMLGAEAYGVDISSEAVDKARGYLKKYSISGRAIVCDARKIDFPDNYFDKVISSDFLEHMSFQDNVVVLKEIKRLLKPDGTAVIKTPNLTYLRLSRIFKMLVAILKLKNPFSIVIPYTNSSNHQHIGLLSAAKMSQLIRSAGFLNFSFCYDRNSRIEKLSYSLSDFLAQLPLLRDIFSEDVIVLLRKPVINSLFPDQHNSDDSQ